MFAHAKRPYSRPILHELKSKAVLTRQRKSRCKYFMDLWLHYVKITNVYKRTAKKSNFKRMNIRKNLKQAWHGRLRTFMLKIKPECHISEKTA